MHDTISTGCDADGSRKPLNDQDFKANEPPRQITLFSSGQILLCREHDRGENSSR